MKRSFFQAAVVSILLYGCTTWTLTKRLEKKLNGNYTRMLRAILNKSWRQHPIRRQLYGHLPPITKTIQVRRARHAGHCWRSRDELISDVLQWTPTYGRTKAGRPARTYIQQLCEDTGCSPEDLPEAINDKEKWRERIRDIRASGTTWRWWWCIYLSTYLSIYLSLPRVVQTILTFLLTSSWPHRHVLFQKCWVKGPTHTHIACQPPADLSRHTPEQYHLGWMLFLGEWSQRHGGSVLNPEERIQWLHPGDLVGNTTGPTENKFQRFYFLSK